MGKRVRIDGLSSAITDTLNEYSNHVSAEAKTAIRQAAKTAVKELKKTSPRDSGDYAKSWKSEVVSESAETIHVTVYAGIHQYSLPHLLENGHAKRGGGRVKAIPHIGKVNADVMEMVEKEILKRI